MKQLAWLSAAYFLLLIACGPIAVLAPPAIDGAGSAVTPSALNGELQKMEGVYSLSGGSNGLGNRFVCKATRSGLVLFSEKAGIYIILKPLQQQPDRTLQLAGFWRYTKRQKQGIVLLSVKHNSLAFEGSFDNKPFSLKFDRPFSEAAINKKFIVLGHRGVQTEAYPPYAENSINALKHVEEYGVSGMEMDIRLTADNIPICMHDETVTPRTVRKSSLIGKWNEHTYQVIREQVQLRDGQQVPSLEEALDTFVDSTTLTYLWMDIKGGKDIFRYIEPLVRKAYAKAAARNRHIVLLAGIPADDVLDELHAQPTYKGLPTLFEKSADLAIENAGAFYGPRYSEGLHLEDGEKAHRNGIKMVCWTIDKERLIKKYLQQGNFDGFLTDNPAFVLYNLYTLF